MQGVIPISVWSTWAIMYGSDTMPLSLASFEALYQPRHKGLYHFGFQSGYSNGSIEAGH